MANPAYWRAPLGVAKRLKQQQISATPCSIRPLCITRPQQAGFADVADLPLQTSKTPEEMAEEPNFVNAIAPSQEGHMPQRRSRRQPPPPPPPGFDQLNTLDPRTKELLYNMDLPPNVQAVYLKPLKRAPTHGIPVCDLQLRSYSIRNLEFFTDFAMRAAYYLGLSAKGPVPLPQITERWTVPRGPFVHKKSQENFERKTLRRLIQVQDGHADVVQAWLNYLEKRAYYGVGMKANVWEWESLDVAKTMDENAKVVAGQAEELFKDFGVYEGDEDIKKGEWDEFLTRNNRSLPRRPPKEIARE